MVKMPGSLPYSRGTWCRQYSQWVQEEGKTYFAQKGHEHSTPTVNKDEAFQHRSFKFKSIFNTIDPYQLESVFSVIENDLQSTTHRQPRTKNPTRNKYKAIKSLRLNSEIIIKSDDKGSAIVIMDKSAYINESRQLSDTHFYSEINEDLSGKESTYTWHAWQGTINRRYL